MDMQSWSDVRKMLTLRALQSSRDWSLVTQSKCAAYKHCLTQLYATSPSPFLLTCSYWSRESSSSSSCLHHIITTKASSQLLLLWRLHSILDLLSDLYPLPHRFRGEDRRQGGRGRGMGGGGGKIFCLTAMLSFLSRSVHTVSAVISHWLSQTLS